ncbi:hypothetical protein VTL71DRAFT_6570 [Oculimacula yallundae]|uniref:Uncharacterized protein n=1 Tax=Oculimacula yallundae TaxID=86028 RepID=A0ABR4BXA8_9HELO
MQIQCPETRIPYIYGFSFSNNRHYVHEEQMSFYIRLWQTFQRRIWNLLGLRILSPYIAHTTNIRPYCLRDTRMDQLANRPLPPATPKLENEGALRTTQKNETYICTEPFVSDMLALHEDTLLDDPKRGSLLECRSKMAAGLFSEYCHVITLINIDERGRSICSLLICIRAAFSWMSI